MADPITAGDKAPAFDLPTDDGENASLKRFKGKPFVLYFYPRDDTPGCTKEAIGFSEHIDAFEKAGVKVVGVSKDSVEKHAKFRDKHDLKVILASDPDGSTVEAFGSWVEKNMYGKTSMGIERSTFLIDDKGVVREVWRKVKVPGHVAAVLAAAKAL